MKTKKYPWWQNTENKEFRSQCRILLFVQWKESRLRIIVVYLCGAWGSENENRKELRLRKMKEMKTQIIVVYRCGGWGSKKIYEAKNEYVFILKDFKKYYYYPPGGNHHHNNSCGRRKGGMLLINWTSPNSTILLIVNIGHPRMR